MIIIVSYSILPALVLPSRINGLTGEITLSSPNPTVMTEYTVTASYNALLTSTKFNLTFTFESESYPVVFLSLGVYSNYQFVSNIPVYIVFQFDEGTASSCEVTPRLPEGLVISKDRITGTTVANSETIVSYNIECSNDYSTTNVFVLQSAVSKTPLEGLVATYSKVENDEIDCTVEYNALTSTGMTIRYQRIDSAISHPYAEFAKEWKDLGSDFAENFVVTWKGYINIAKEGTYTFALESNKGSWLKIDEGGLIDNGGCHEMKMVDGQLNLGVGYHLLEISYFQTTGSNGFRFLMSSDGSDQKEVESSLLSYIPPSSLTYQYTYTTYVVNDAIITNSPILYGITISQYSATNLPLGLHIDSLSGVISGTPEVTTEKQYITVKVTGLKPDSLQITTEIHFSIIEDLPPSQLKIRVYDMYEVSEEDDVYVHIGHETILQLSSTGKNTIYSISPELPDGFKLDNGAVSGNCTEPFNNQYMMIATNEGGRATRIFRFICSNICPIGFEPLEMYLKNNYVNKDRHYSISLKAEYFLYYNLEQIRQNCLK